MLLTNNILPKRDDASLELRTLLEQNEFEPPTLFIELLELAKDKQNESVWRETSRWIKFEENVDQGGARWSKAHVGTISISVMKKVRSMLANAHFFFDESHTNLHDIIEADAKTIFPNSVVQNSFLTELISDRCYRHLTKHNMNTEKKVKRHFAEKIPKGAEGCVILAGHVEFLEDPLVMFIRLAEPTRLSGITEVAIDTKFVIVVLGRETYKDEFHQIGRVFGNIMADPVVKNVAYTASEGLKIIEAFEEFSSSSVAMSPNQWDPRIRLIPPLVKDNGMDRLYSSEFKGHSQGVGYGDGGMRPSDHEMDDSLKRTGKLFGGLIADVKRKLPFYVSDWTDGFNIQCVATTMFLYFAIITPIITFGGLLADATDNNIAAMESMVGGAIAGSLYHIFAGQPLTIIGSTGPILVFETIMFHLCHDMNLNYLELRVWVGTWIGVMCIILVATDASYLVMYITRYTEESFSTLISLIFITDGIKKLIHIYDYSPMDTSWETNTVLDYSCSCFVPQFSGTIEKWYQNMTESDWITNATQRIVMHGKIPEPERYWSDESSYHCVYKDGYNYVELSSATTWTDNDTDTCRTHCGVLDGASCPLYLIDPETVNSASGVNKTLLETAANHGGIELPGALAESLKIDSFGKVYAPDVFLFSLFLSIGTLAISFTLKGLRQQRYFSVRARTLISEFAVVIAIACMVSVDYFVGLQTPKLHVPAQFEPTRGYADRGWFIPPFGKNPTWSIGLAAVFALMGTILLFMDQQITAVIVNRRENKLKKGVGYHLDLLVAAIAVIICSWMGLPWFIAATVLSITHVNSLKAEAHQKIPGEPDTFSGCIEQRLTGLLIFILIGCSIFLAPILVHIPMPVLYGVFLYMGFSSLKGVQLFDRIKLLFIPKKHHPDYAYLRHVSVMKVHLFTCFQVLGLAMLWAIKSYKPASIVFPLMVAAIVGIRKVFDFFPKLFTQRELSWLDDIIPESEKKSSDEEKDLKNGNVKI